ncbi:MAG: UDP-N-acetylmuramate dehydrogenase [Deltaproteobacteria bacterium]|nr:UDP-N-acetylmuramate dehydrogenase [Deltaproteobacteria bacterium]
MTDDKGKNDMLNENLTEGPLSPMQRAILEKWQSKIKRSVPQALKDVLQTRFAGEVLFDEPMSRHTYVRIGGPAEVFLIPQSREALMMAVRVALDHNIPYCFHGAGANTLVKDGGIRGLVISTYKSLTDCHIVEQNDDHIDIRAEAGLIFSQLIQVAKEQGAADLAPFVGIPGSVGGLVKMNAGTKTREIKDVLRSLTLFNREGEEIILSREKLDFEYRSLKIPRSSYILDATFRLQELVSPDEVAALMKQYQEKRVNTQPLDCLSLGSVFKNPVPRHKKEILPGAGRLIEEAGLKNIRVGGARVSPKHANFIINEGNATAKDYLSLIGLIRDRIKQNTGIVLETEIEIVGEDR